MKTRSGRIIRPVYESTLRSARAPPQFDVVRARGRSPPPKPIGKQRSDPVIKHHVNTKSVSKTKTKAKSRPRKTVDVTVGNFYEESSSEESEEDEDEDEETSAATSDFEDPPFNRSEIKWYHIYSPIPNSYQADLMFMKYANAKNEEVVDTILSMININTRYLFAKVVSSNKTGKIVKKKRWGFFIYGETTKKKKTTENQDIMDVYKDFGGKYTSAQTASALKKILESIPEEREKLITSKRNRDAKVKEIIKDLKEKGEKIPKGYKKLPQGDPDIDIDRIFVDEGNEFKGEFNKKCMDENIKLYVFKKEEGAKRRMALIERSHKILRIMLVNARRIGKKTKGKSYTELLPIVLKRYNYKRDHRMLRAFFNRNNNRDPKRGPLEQASRKSIFSPNLMHDPGREDQYVDWMKEKETKTDKHYKEKVQKILRPGQEVKYFKRRYENAFNDKGLMPMSKRLKVIGKHDYQWKQKNPRTGKLTVKNMTGKSFKLEGEKSRFMPYELYLKDKKIKKQKKRKK